MVINMAQTRRERLRQMALDDIKTLAWDMIAQKGIENLRINGIARQMGITPPAFYRYFKNRDELVKTLVLDAYGSFRTALEKARDEICPSEPVKQIFQVYMEYRDWAVATPNRFKLFAGRKVYGFDPKDSRVTKQADKVYLIFIELYQRAWEGGMVLTPKTGAGIPQSYMAGLERYQKEHFPDVPVEIIDLCIAGACMAHGMISMEISGRLLNIVGSGALFYAYQIKDLMKRQGMDISPL